MPLFSASATRGGRNKDGKKDGTEEEFFLKGKRRTLGDVAVEGVDDDCNVGSHG
jgi:hypothetical protein